MESGTRKRAVGTRDRVMAHLVTAGEVTEPGGMASTVLAEAVGYPGSSVAFAQLLSGMERAGLIEREIRGKRTYRIRPAAAAAEVARSGGAGRPGSKAAAAGRPGSKAAAAGRPGSKAAAAGRPGSKAAAGLPGSGAAGLAGFDYDELARRLLVQVVQRLAETPPQLASPEQAGDAGLQQAVASLEQKLASVQSKQRRLSAENAKLREQLRAAQQSLAQAQEQAQSAQFGSAEVRLLERLLSPLRQQPGGREEAGAS